MPRGRAHRDPSPRALVATGAALVVTSVAVAGCAGSGVLGGDAGDAHACVSWVDFATPADAAADADLVVVADGATPSGTRRTFGAEATVHTVVVREVLHGTAAVVGEALEVVSTPVTCSGEADLYPGGDPLATDGTVVVLLHDDPAVGWRTMTPSAGVVTASPDGGLPDGWDG
ncbi:hypothetical protein ICW40_08935 [Actinotalea ferrariae]|uniref:hypothetical protein n=1 Tax=Actinotalea ferrariae TaxID=1386098 RepID=UPI001C8B945C|nr:hypothetical protein [Actinotalea ferrariae]MBX9244933.1 hypothetical protein [Actinotalea ferrariae]